MTCLFDMTTGNNATFATPQRTCGNDYLCTAKKGYDAPTGLGTPDGTGAFRQALADTLPLPAGEGARSGRLPAVRGRKVAAGLIRS